MSLPVVAIVGRPNVGKSSLLNALVRQRIAIVDPTPGVTRDRVSVPLLVGESSYVELVDTGGMGIEDSAGLTEHVEAQIDYALAAAAMVLFVVDGREGITPLDRHVAERLRRHNKPALLVANKIDAPDQTYELADFYALGFGDPLAVSAAHALGTADVVEAIGKTLEGAAADRPAPAVMKLAVVGKRNAGKSTLINALAGEDRVIVSQTPGTTRDSVDVTVEFGGRRFTLIDTAGVRKKRKMADDVEFYGHTRAMKSIRRADVVALVIDASVPISRVDKALAGQIAAQHKPVLLVVNKWDLARGKAAGEDYSDYLAKTFPELAYAPLSLTTATRGTNVRRTVRLAEELYDQARTRVTTGQLNAELEEILAARGPSHKAGTKPPKVLYASQIGTEPPTIALVVNDVRSFDGGYRRYLLNRLRERLPFAEVPIRLVIRPRRGRK